MAKTPIEQTARPLTRNEEIQLRLQRLETGSKGLVDILKNGFQDIALAQSEQGKRLSARIENMAQELIHNKDFMDALVLNLCQPLVESTEVNKTPPTTPSGPKVLVFAEDPNNQMAIRVTVVNDGLHCDVWVSDEGGDPTQGTYVRHQFGPFTTNYLMTELIRQGFIASDNDAGKVLFCLFEQVNTEE